MKLFLYFTCASALAAEVSSVPVLAVKNSSECPSEYSRAIITVGGSDVKAFKYCLDKVGVSVLSEPKTGYRPEVRTGISNGLQNGIISTDQIGDISSQVKNVWDQLLKAADATGQPSINKKDITVVLTSVVEEQRNVDALVSAISKAIPDANEIQIQLIDSYSEGVFGLLDQLNFVSEVYKSCDKSNDIKNAIFINVGSANSNIIYYGNDSTFHSFEIPFGGKELVSLSETVNDAVSKDTTTREARIRKVLDNKINKSELLRNHRAIFDRTKYPKLYMTGGTVWATTRIVAASLDINQQQIFKVQKECYLNIPPSYFKKAVDKLNVIGNGKNILVNYQEFSHYLNKILENNDHNTTDKTEISPDWTKKAQEKDLDFVLAAYGNKLEELTAQAIMVDWLLEAIDRKACDEHDKDCKIFYKNMQDNWARIYAYRDFVKKDLKQSDNKIKVPDINLDYTNKIIAEVNQFYQNKPKISFRSRDMLRN
jgi:hypothetical protein